MVEPLDSPHSRVKRADVWKPHVSDLFELQRDVLTIDAICLQLSSQSSTDASTRSLP